MKNLFSFLGIQKPMRTELSKDFLKEKCRNPQIDWDFVDLMFDMEEREFQYLALEYLGKMQKKLQKEDIYKIERLIQLKSWWDTVDTLAPLVGVLCIKYPELKEEHVKDWITHNNIWLNRVSIIFQLKYKNDVDTDFLSRAILSNKATKEFFINKAIGWALRQYSKSNADWVRVFLAENELHSLSVREARKYL
jgi:3-methyladenine DNA glycosylase AlkD